MPSPVLRRALTTASLTVAAGVPLAAAPAANAGVLVSSAPDCEIQTLAQPFAPWLDPSQYTLVPDGGLEQGGAGWSLSGGAQVVSGNEPWSVGGAGDSSSLSLPSGSSATTGSMCVGIEHPTMRFFVRRSSGSMFSSVKVDAVFEDNGGDVHSAQIAAVGGSSSWSPTAPVPILVNLLPLLPGDHTPVEFRFRPSDGSSWTVDDVYVDPPRRCC